MAGQLGLALSGGGAKGAYQVGALDFLVNEKGVDFRIVGGVSTGALQAVMVAQGDVGKLLEVWKGIESPDDIFTERIGGILGGLFGADSVYSNEPLEEKIRKHVKPERILASGRKLRIGVASLQTGEYRLVTETSGSLKDWILASTAIPAFFEPVEKLGEQFVDGGVRDVTPLGGVIDERPDACLVILASPLKMKPTAKPFPNLVKIGMRAIDVMSDEVLRNDLEEARWVNGLLRALDHAETTIRGLGDAAALQALAPLREFLREYSVIPTYTLAPKKLVIDTLDFDPDHIKAALKQGRDQAREEWPAIEKALGLATS